MFNKNNTAAAGTIRHILIVTTIGVKKWLRFDFEELDAIPMSRVLVCEVPMVVYVFTQNAEKEISKQLRENSKACGKQGMIKERCGLYWLYMTLYWWLTEAIM